MRGQSHAPVAPYPFYRRLDGPQASPPPGFDPRTVQPVGSRYTDYDTPPTCAHVLYKCIRGLQKTSCKLITKLRGGEGVIPAGRHSCLAFLRPTYETSARQAANFIDILFDFSESLDGRAGLVPQHSFLLYSFQFLIC